MGFRDKYAAAVDIQETYVRCVQMRYSSHSWHVHQTGTKEIPASADEDVPHTTHTAHAVKTLLQEMGIYPPRNLVTCISGRDAAIRLLSLPPVDDRNMGGVEGMVKYELISQLPMNVEKMSYDYHIVDRSIDGTVVLTVAAKRSVLDRHLRVLSLAGVTPDTVTISSLALLNAFAQKEPDGMLSGGTGLLCLRDSGGDAVVCQDGKLAYTRSFTFGSSREHLVREIHNSFDTYVRARSSGNREIEKIYVMTENGELPLELTEDDLSGIVPGASWHVSAMGDDLALGLAMAGARPCPRAISGMVVRLNLRRQIAQEERVARGQAIRSRLARMAPVVAIPVLMAVSGTLWWQVHRAEKEVYSLGDIQELSKQRMVSIKQLSAVEKELQKQTSFLDWSEESYPMVSYRLYQVARTIPGSLWLKEVYIPEQKAGKRRGSGALQPISELRVVGYAHRQEEIRDFMAALSRCDCFLSVKQESTAEIRVSGERILEFEIGLVSHPEKAGAELVKAGKDG